MAAKGFSRLSESAPLTVRAASVAHSNALREYVLSDGQVHVLATPQHQGGPIYPALAVGATLGGYGRTGCRFPDVLARTFPLY
jgi:hypothetical protein